MLCLDYHHYHFISNDDFSGKYCQLGGNLVELPSAPYYDDETHYRKVYCIHIEQRNLSDKVICFIEKSTLITLTTVQYHPLLSLFRLPGLLLPVLQEEVEDGGLLGGRPQEEGPGGDGHRGPAGGGEDQPGGLGEDHRADGVQQDGGLGQGQA